MITQIILLMKKNLLKSAHVLNAKEQKKILGGAIDPCDLPCLCPVDSKIVEWPCGTMCPDGGFPITPNCNP